MEFQIRLIAIIAFFIHSVSNADLHIQMEWKMESITQQNVAQFFGFI